MTPVHLPFTVELAPPLRGNLGRGPFGKFVVDCIDKGGILFWNSTLCRRVEGIEHGVL